jgi:hypothetical protein
MVAGHTSGCAHIKGFPCYGDMNITLSVDDKLVKEVRKIATEKDTTLTGLVSRIPRTACPRTRLERAEAPRTRSPGAQLHSVPIQGRKADLEAGRSPCPYLISSKAMSWFMPTT